MSSTDQPTSIQVWDPLVRYGHWALVIAFAVAYLSGEDESGGPDRLHIWSGYAVGFIVAVRILWGLVGAGHARFSDFTYGPITALKYFADELRGRAKRYIGHSPAAAYMIAALLVCLTATIGTGLVANSDGGKREARAADRAAFGSWAHLLRLPKWCVRTFRLLRNSMLCDTKSIVMGP
jgi:cytochrome b